MALCVILAELWLILCKNSQIFVTMAIGVVDVYFNNIIKLLDLENPPFGAGFVALSLVLAVL